MHNDNPYASPQSDGGVPKCDGDAAIRVTRTTSYPDRIRAYRILVGGREMAKLNAGQSVIIPVSSGTHSVVAKIDWCGSPTLTFSIRAGETVEFQCGSNLCGLRIFLNLIYIIFLRNQYLTLTRI